MKYSPRRSALLLALVAATVASAFAGAGSTRTPLADVPELDGLSNVIQVTSTIYSGSEPATEEAFLSLKSLGVRTVVSVDAVKPDLELARKMGMGYVHIPIGYVGIPKEAAAAMRKALDERPAPFYIHCHHGVHRGPAMAAIAMQAETSCPTQLAREFMAKAGVSEKYTGLWKDALEVDFDALAKLDPALHETAPIGSFPTAMANIDRTWDRVVYCYDAGWETPPDHPDVQPLQEAKILAERFQQLAQAEDQPVIEPTFQELMDGSWRDAQELHEALGAGDKAQADKHFMRVRRACSDCHGTYRN